MRNDSTNDDKELEKHLTPEEYHVLREGGTEPAFSGEYVDLKDSGMYHCKACGMSLFSSTDKFDSGTGWPSFTKAVKEGSVTLLPDSSHGMQRTEARCATCGSHLGHVFSDGPADTGGNRYCINSLALDFKEK